VQQAALRVDLAPGDALYIPEGWWHQVDSSGERHRLVAAERVVGPGHQTGGGRARRHAHTLR
jgi:mannose-6-phosphate isomerase-like protein (cupin superfamily)